MGLFTNSSLGTSTYGEAHKFIIKHNLWGWILLPGIINLLLFIAVVYFGAIFADTITDWVYGKLGLNAAEQGWFLKVLFFFARGLINIILKIALIFLYFASYKYIVFTILSPFLALLSEKVEHIMTGNTYKFEFKQYVNDVIRGLRICFRNMFIEFFWIFLMLLASFIPLVNFVTPFVLFYISSYFFGFGFMDYSLERYKMSVKDSVKFVRKNRGLAFANGSMFYLLFLIPVVGLLVAPAYATIAAAIACEKIKQKENNKIQNT